MTRTEDAFELDLRAEVLAEFDEASRLGHRFHEVTPAAFVCVHREVERRRRKEKERRENEELRLRRPGKRLALMTKKFFATPNPTPNPDPNLASVYHLYRAAYGVAGEVVAKARPTCARCGRACASAGAVRYCCPRTRKAADGAG